MEKTKKKIWIIAIAVAIIYLTISILFDLWAFSWIIWVAYAIYRFIVR
ncbi:MAG: WxxxWxxW domain-containing protein [Mediterraneibacter gnavus]